MRHRIELRQYQQRVATALYENDEKLCVIRPGGGKTAAALTAIRELIDDGVIRHALVLAPKRVARNVWPDEIAEWMHLMSLRYAVLDGLPKKREALLTMSSVMSRDITIVGLDIVQWLMERLVGMSGNNPLFDLLCIDEISKLRDPTGKRSALLAKNSGRWKMIWGLSGTLRPNGPLDLFMPARIVTRGKLWGRSYYKWRQERFHTTDYQGYNWAPLPGTEERLNEEIAPLTVTLADHEMPQLPKMQVLLDWVEMNPDARLVYDSMEHKLFAVQGDDIVVADSVAISVGKLSQIANGFVYGDDKVVSRVHHAKRDWLQEVIDQASGPTILVYEYMEDFSMLQWAFGGRLPYIGAGMTDRQTAQTIADWNAGRLPFMGLHPASGGHGLNLQMGGADMAWLAPCWSPELWEQTIARLHRSGQTKPVMVRVCMAKKTIDEVKFMRVQGKMGAQEAFEAYLRNHHVQIKMHA